MKWSFPVLDARRMEVYSAVFDHQHQEIRETRAEVIDTNSFQEYANAKKVHIVGNGATKCAEILKHTNLIFDDSVMPSAQEMGAIAHQKFEKALFEDVAYFEPYYLKDFVLQGQKELIGFVNHSLWEWEFRFQLHQNVI